MEHKGGQDRVHAVLDEERDFRGIERRTGLFWSPIVDRYLRHRRDALGVRNGGSEEEDADDSINSITISTVEGYKASPTWNRDAHEKYDGSCSTHFARGLRPS